MKCVFCNRYNLMKEIDEKFGTPPGITHVYKVALIQHSKREGEKDYRGRSTDYNTKGIGFKLNYCPECGKRLK